MPIHNVAILGLGLIGGSLAKAWRAADLALHVTGFDRPEVLDAAQKAGVIDQRAATWEAAVAEADLVVLALPLPALLDVLPRLGPHLKPDALVTDVGSVKGAVEAAAFSLPAGTFVGGHPMAGAERGGFEASDALLFENAVYVLCPPAGAPPPKHFDALVELVEATGARVLLLDARQHDRIAAHVSHVPQLLAVALAQSTGEAAQADDALLTLAAGGFRDMTRIASSPFSVWEGIVAANREEIAAALDRLLRHLTGIRDTLGRDPAQLGEAFEAAARTRAHVPERGKGFLHPLHEVNLYAVDEPGFLFRITSALYQAGLNVKDLELLKIREGTGGTFRLGFATAADARAAVEVLRAAGFRADPRPT